MNRRRTRLLSLIAACVLIMALGAFSAHVPGHHAHNNGHCDLCVHLSGSAGSAAQAAAVGKPALAARLAPKSAEHIRAERRRGATQLPRGPPSLADNSSLIQYS
jgi:hypothetical protein